MSVFYADDHLTVRGGDCRAELRELPADSVHVVMTSPPYYSLRDYGIEPATWGSIDPKYPDDCFAQTPESLLIGHGSAHVWGNELPPRAGGRGNKPGDYSTSALTNPQRQDEVPRATSSGQYCQRCSAWRGQLGLEPHPDLYVEHMVEVFREVRRVLHPEGTVWLNLGDSFAAERSGTEMPAETMAGGVGGHGDQRSKRGRPSGRKADQPEDRLARHDGLPHRHAARIGLKHKDLIGIPWRVAFALQADGWWLRRDVVWSKPNPMPESAEDRPSSSHEYVFMLTKSDRYFYDRIAVLEGDVAGHSSGNGFARPERISGGLARGRDDEWTPGGGRNRRSVWTIATKPYKGAHFAVFPPALVEVPLKASTSSCGACPECGAQWRRQSVPSAAYSALLGSDRIRGDEYSAELDAAQGRMQGRGRTDDKGAGSWRRPREDETLGWRPGCGHGWGGVADDLDLIASPMRSGREAQPQEHMPGSGQRPSGQRGNRTSDIEATTRRGLDRERRDGEGRRIITRFEQRAYARQLKAWDDERSGEALDQIAEWLGREVELATWREIGPAEDHPGIEAWRHYLRDDRRGARAIPPKLFDRWLAAGWLTPVEPPDFSGALTPVPSVALDIFGGSGTVGLVAQSLGRRAILIDVNPDYLVQQMKRNQQTSLGMGT